MHSRSLLQQALFFYMDGVALMEEKLHNSTETDESSHAIAQHI